MFQPDSVLVAADANKEFHGEVTVPNKTDAALLVVPEPNFGRGRRAAGICAPCEHPGGVRTVFTKSGENI